MRSFEFEVLIEATLNAYSFISLLLMKLLKLLLCSRYLYRNIGVAPCFSNALTRYQRSLDFDSIAQTPLCEIQSATDKT